MNEYYETHPVILAKALSIASKLLEGSGECPAIYDFELEKCEFCENNFNQDKCWYEVCLNEALKEMKKINPNI